MGERTPNLAGAEGGPAGNRGSRRWFYVHHGAMYGPISSADLRAAAHLGFIGPDDIVRRSDQTTWIPARSVRGLFRQPD